MINGVVYDFETIKMQLPSGIVNSLDEISYSATKDVDVLTDTKGNPRGVVRKAYEGDFSCTMSLYEYGILERAAGARGILSMDSMPVIVSFAQTGASVVTHQLMVKITKITPGIQKDDEVKVQLEGKQTAIMKTNGKPVYSAV